MALSDCAAFLPPVIRLSPAAARVRSRNCNGSRSDCERWPRRSREFIPTRSPSTCSPTSIPFSKTATRREEMKMQNEGRRIMHLPDFRASVTCVRVPVYRAHSVAMSAEFERPVSLESAREVLAKAPGLDLIDEPLSAPLSHCRSRLPARTIARSGVCGVDCALENGLALWVSGDQLAEGRGAERGADRGVAVSHAPRLLCRVSLSTPKAEIIRRDVRVTKRRLPA